MFLTRQVGSLPLANNVNYLSEHALSPLDPGPVHCLRYRVGQGVARAAAEGGRNLGGSGGMPPQEKFEI